jgi:hypothetical protein
VRAAAARSEAALPSVRQFHAHRAQGLGTAFSLESGSYIFMPFDKAAQKGRRSLRDGTDFRPVLRSFNHLTAISRAVEVNRRNSSATLALSDK